MRRQAIESLRAAIEANTERRSIDQLKAQGKRHVRVVSGEKVMQIIKAIVGDIVDREVGELSQRDHDRIVAETKQQFDRVMKLQTEQDALLKEQKELVADYRGKLEAAVAENERVKAEVERVRAEMREREGHALTEYQTKLQDLAEKHRSAADRATDLAHERDGLARQLEDERRHAEERAERVKAEYEGRVEQLHREQRDLVARFESERGDLAGRQEAAVSAAQERAEELEGRVTELSEERVVLRQKVERAEAELAEAREQASAATERVRKAERIVAKQEARFAKARTLIESAKEELERLTAEKQRLEAELAELRTRAGESETVQSLRGELDEMKTFLRTLDERSSGASEATVSALLEQLAEREKFDSTDLESKFAATLDASLDKITRTMEAATAKPIDVVVEATDVLIDKLFDTGEEELSSNYGKLNVTESKSKSGIAGNLQALKALRAAQGGSGSGKPAAQPGGEASADASEGAEDPTAEAAVASAETGSGSEQDPERLKAVREGEGNGS